MAKGKNTGTKITAEDVYADITAKIVAIIESGDMVAWQQCWRSIGYGHHNVQSRHTYTGGNALILGVIAAGRGYVGSEWSTYKGWQALGAQVPKGVPGVRILKPCPWTKELPNAAGELVRKSGTFFTTTSVWHRDQVDNAPPMVTLAPLNPDARIPEIDEQFARVPVRVEVGGQPCYRPGPDFVMMPHFEDFTSGADYYSTLGHELTHATGHHSRLNRELKGLWADEASYAGEELVAELGAAFLLARLGISAEPREDHAPYMASWLRALKGDIKAVFTAAAAAQKAAAWLLGHMQPAAVELDEAEALDELLVPA